MQEMFSVYPTHGRFFKKEIVQQLQSLLASATQTIFNSKLDC